MSRLSGTVRDVSVLFDFSDFSELFDMFDFSGLFDFLTLRDFSTF